VGEAAGQGRPAALRETLTGAHAIAGGLTALLRATESAVPKIKYADLKFKTESEATIRRANSIISEYAAQGLDLTLRQLYYQFVSRNWVRNNQKEYNKLGDVIARGRMAGLIDWDAITDRTRYVRTTPTWESPEEIVATCARTFKFDKWDRQPSYVEVWIEKDALLGVIEGVCKQYEVSYMACRGYASVSEIWRASQRLLSRIERDKQPVILYLGDHDPSGIDMTRDIRDRLNTFLAGSSSPLRPDVRRLALNRDQINLYNPPPNPAKEADSRAKDYIREHGDHCWELDALDPVVIRDLVAEGVRAERDEDAWSESVAEETEARSRLRGVSDRWDDVCGFLGTT